MGLRFFRRVKICKGLYLNFSKSGVGISLGTRGASITLGSRGTYTNLGIPGSGISFRQKINNNQEIRNEDALEERDNKTSSGIKFKFEIDDDGKEHFSLIDVNGNPVRDDTLLRKAKRDSYIKDLVDSTRIKQYERILENDEKIISMHKLTPKLISRNDVEEEMKDTSVIQKQHYITKLFNEPKPDWMSHYKEAKRFAIASVKTWKFWKKGKMIKQLTSQKQDELYAKDLQEWEKKQDDFLKSEEQIKITKDAEYNQEYEEKLKEREELYMKILNPDEEYLQETINDVLAQVELPIEFAIDYDVKGTNISLDIDLPEIEDYPDQIPSILADGRLSVKRKTVVNMNKDYAKSVIGIGFFFAGVIFNISPAIETVSVSGYTQRLNPKTGNIEDQYVYSVDFERKIFAKLNIQRIDPLEAVSNFNANINMTAKYELKTIELKK